MPIKQKGAKQPYLTIQEDRLLLRSSALARSLVERPLVPRPALARPSAPLCPFAIPRPHALARPALARPTLLR
jgi:hypothetical protein